MPYTPSIRYLAYNPVFSFDAAGTPTGGFHRDGRVATLAEQARRPLLAPFEKAACHPSTPGADGAPPLFTDFTYDNLGVPRNADIAARHDLCGVFKVPSLRNVAITAPHFHNGRFGTLAEVIGFYVRRDTHPEEWYPIAISGMVQKFGDLPALSAGEIEDLIAFLTTLTDGYQP